MRGRSSFWIYMQREPLRRFAPHQIEDTLKSMICVNNSDRSTSRHRHHIVPCSHWVILIRPICSRVDDFTASESLHLFRANVITFELLFSESDGVLCQLISFNFFVLRLICYRNFRLSSIVLKNVPPSANVKIKSGNIIWHRTGTHFRSLVKVARGLSIKKWKQCMVNNIIILIRFVLTFKVWGFVFRTYWRFHKLNSCNCRHMWRTTTGSRPSDEGQCSQNSAYRYGDVGNILLLLFYAFVVVYQTLFTYISSYIKDPVVKICNKWEL